MTRHIHRSKGPTRNTSVVPSLMPPAALLTGALLTAIAITTSYPIRASGAGARLVADPPTMQGSSDIIDSEGRIIGSLHWSERDAGGVNLIIQATGLSPGPHAVHLHETGACETPDFESAGGHFNPAGAPHGEMDTDDDLKDPDHHAGDMPNQTVDAQGVLKATLNNRSVSLIDGPNTLLDEDGTALVVHAGVDDYRSQPSGAAGPRVACAIINRTAG